MAGRGFAPKETRSRTRDARRRAAEQTKISADGELRGFALPKTVDGDPWHPATRKWWDIWRRSPQAQRMIDTDWQFLLDTALLHHTMWSRGRTDLAGELRLRAAKFGATLEDRLRLKLTIENPDSTPAPPPPSRDSSVTSIDSRRKRLTS